MTEAIHVLGIAGSLRKKSYNLAALHAAMDVLPEAMTLEIYDIAAIPLFNQDVEALGFPESVQHFKARIAAANALLIATPEYNYSIPGVLKNALDWASRPATEMPLSEKPLAIMGVSGGPWGTARAQLALRQSCVYMNMHPLNRPVLQVPHAESKFDADGKLTDEATRQHIRGLLVALASWARRLNRVPC
jgi:chromate reductase, NAD(P)H dehydrogenase (quinone)